MNFTSCVALTGQVKKKKAEYFECFKICFKNVLSFMIVDKKAYINTFFFMSL